MPQWSDNLKIELLDIGASNWGNLTNNNFKFAIEESITGYATVTFPSDANYNWAAGYVNSNSSQAQRNLVLNVVGTLSQTRELIVPTIEKQYIVQNNTTGSQSITVKTSAGTGVNVPAGRKMHVYVDGTNVVQMSDYDITRTIGTLSLTNALAVAQGGTGVTTSTGSGAVVLATSPTLITPVLGVASATSINKITITAPATSATLTIANGKTLAANNSITLAGTDATTMTFPGTNATIARTDAAQTFTGTQTFNSDAAINGLTVGRGAGAVSTNTAVGGSALAANTTGDNNTASGVSALLSNTTGSNNTASGYQALVFNTTGNFNTASGVSALAANTTGSSNTALGNNALGANTTGNFNTASGVSALLSNTTGSSNTASGVSALLSNTTGNSNTASGVSALYANTTGSSNTASGVNALYSNTTGNFNTASGVGALLSNTTGSNNTASGRDALYFNTTGGNNTASGVSALVFNTTGNNNTASGFQALYLNTTGGSNTASGFQALRSNTTGSNNTASGFQALYSNITGSNNTASGYGAGDVITTGSRNTIIGDNSDPSTAGGNDQTVVGQGLTGKGNDTAFIGGTNGAYNEKNVTTWETTSDARIKKNIVDNHDGLEKIQAIRVRNFEYRTPEEITELPTNAGIQKTGMQLGVIAQEMLPECVSTTSEGMLSVNTDSLVWYLVNAVKELSAQVQALQSQLK